MRAALLAFYVYDTIHRNLTATKFIEMEVSILRLATSPNSHDLFCCYELMWFDAIMPTYTIDQQFLTMI